MPRERVNLENDWCTFQKVIIYDLGGRGQEWKKGDLLVQMIDDDDLDCLSSDREIEKHGPEMF